MTQERQNIPKLRFPEFEEEWQSGKLIDLFKVKHGFPFKSEYFSKNGRWIVTTPGNFAPEGGFRYQKEKEKYYTSDDFPNEYILSKNDLLTAMTEQAEGLIGSAILIPDDNRFLHNQRLGLLNLSKTANRYFIFHYLKTFRIRKDISLTAAGTKVRHTSPEKIENVEAVYPKFPEQEKIANFLTAVDEKIGQLERKKGLLTDYKKGVMQQLFSQQVRFKDDQGNDFPEWEEKKLGEVLCIGSGRDYKHLSSGTIPVYGSGGVMTHVNEYLYDGESVCIGRKGTIDQPQFLRGKFWTVDTLFYTHKFQDVIPAFILAVFQQINWKKYNEASGVPSLSKSTIESIKVKIPHPSEQQKIANYLTALDHKIELTNKKLTQAQSFKKGLLQQMFV